MPKTVLKKPEAMDAEVKRTMNQKEAAQYLGVKYRAFRLIIASGELPYRPCGKQQLFTKINLDRWLNYRPTTEEGGQVE